MYHTTTRYVLAFPCQGPNWSRERGENGNVEGNGDRRQGMSALTAAESFYVVRSM